MKLLWSRYVKVGVLVTVIVLLTVQFLILPNSHYSTAKPLATFKNFTVDQSSNGSAVTRWILQVWDFVNNQDRNLEISKQRTDILLLVRKLVVFSVRAVNQRLVGTPCAPCWANPLSVTEFSEAELSPGVKEYTLKFEVHPGAIPVESTVRLRRDTPNATHPYPSPDLLFIGAKRLDSGAGKNCQHFYTIFRNSRVPIAVVPICICPEELNDAAKVTASAREAWTKSDPELPTWPVNTSMSVPDYIRFSTMDLYLKSPVNHKNLGFCGPEVKMLVFISSAPKHFSQRASIRSTFGNFSFLEANGARLLFLFGAVNDEKLQKEIDEEFLENNDIVQADFADSYHNLTLSHLSMYNWVVTQCKGQEAAMPRWILKADDDFFVNVPLALRIAAVNQGVEIIGVAFCGTKAVRNVSYMTKYYVPRYMYAPNYYAGYVSGVAYIVRTDVLEAMLKASLTTPIIHMDDVYVMGLLAREVGIRPINSRLISYGKGANRCDILKTMSTFVTNSTLEEMWADFQGLSQDECKVADEDLKVLPLNDGDIKSCLFN